MKKADLIIPFGMWCLSQKKVATPEAFYLVYGNKLKRMTIPEIRQEIAMLKMEFKEAA